MTSCAAVAKWRYPGSPPRSAPPQGPAALPLPPPHAICAAVPFLAPRAAARNGAGSLPFSGARLAPCPMARSPPPAPAEPFSERAERRGENAALRRKPRLCPSEPSSPRFCVPGSRLCFSRSCPASRYGRKGEGGRAAPSAVPCFSPRGARRLSAGSAGGEGSHGGSPPAPPAHHAPRPSAKVTGARARLRSALLSPRSSAAPQPRETRRGSPPAAGPPPAFILPALPTAGAAPHGTRPSPPRARSAAAPLPPFAGRAICSRAPRRGAREPLESKRGSAPSAALVNTQPLPPRAASGGRQPAAELPPPP